MSLNKKRCRLIELPRHDDSRGVLSHVEGVRQVPFAFCRLFWIYDAPAGVSRGGHAHRECEQFLISIHGKVKVETDEGGNRCEYLLDNPWLGLYVPANIWLTLRMASENSVLLVLASHNYDPSDYISNHDEFLRLTELGR